MRRLRIRWLSYLYSYTMSTGWVYLSYGVFRIELRVGSMNSCFSNQNTVHICYAIPYES
jgi:hypothetical protein